METLTAQPRKILGKSVRILRKDGFLPAVAYGKGVESEHVVVPYNEFVKIWKLAGESSLILLKLPKGEKNALIHDVALDSIKNIPIHADFYLVDMKQKVEVEVPVEFIGEEEAAKASGGLVVKIMYNLKVEALPNELPHSIMVDVTPLKAVGDSIAVKDIAFPKGVAALHELHETIVLIEALRAEEEPEVAAPSISNIEVITEKKETEEGEGEAPMDTKSMVRPNPSGSARTDDRV